MKIGARTLRWTPATVSWLSFVIMGLVVAGVGLTGTAHVVGYLHERLTAHGVGHNREIAEHLAPLLVPTLGSVTEPTPEALQRAVATYGVFGYRVFVVDRQQRLLVADSQSGPALPVSLEASWLGDATGRNDGRAPLSREEGTATAIGEDDHPMLIWFEDMGAAEGQGGRWLLGVASDQKTLAEFLGDLHWHLDGVMLLTYLLIAVLGYFSMRGIGRVYERNLEAQVRERTLALQAVHEEMLNRTRLATIGQTASVLTHEMRNPLASIKLVLSGLKSAETIPERERRRVGLVLGEVDRLDDLLSETLDYVRPVRLSDRPLVLDELLSQVLKQQMPLLEAKGIRLNRKASAGDSAIRMDEAQMHQVLLNLLKNAVEASPQGGEIRLSLQHQEGTLVLDLENGGDPLSEETEKRAFEPFYSTKPKGTGLGLGLAKRVVEEHGGTIELSSGAATGTRVTLRIPCEPSSYISQ